MQCRRKEKPNSERLKASGTRRSWPRMGNTLRIYRACFGTTRHSMNSARSCVSNERRTIARQVRRRRRIKKRPNHVHPRHRLDHARPKGTPAPHRKTESYTSRTAIHHVRDGRITVEGTAGLSKSAQRILTTPGTRPRGACSNNLLFQRVEYPPLSARSGCRVSTTSQAASPGRAPGPSYCRHRACAWIYRRHQQPPRLPASAEPQGRGLDQARLRRPVQAMWRASQPFRDMMHGLAVIMIGLEP
jgi:hypothetical protein